MTQFRNKNTVAHSAKIQLKKQKTNQIPHSGTHPLNKSFLCGHLKVPQIHVSTFGPHSHRAGMSGMPLQTGDSAVEGTGGSMEMVG